MYPYFINTLNADHGRWPLWIPVLLGLGIAFYFALPFEPPLWIGGSLLILLMSLLIIRPYRLFVSMGLICALGFTAAQVRVAIKSTFMLSAPTRTIMVEGVVNTVEHKPTKNNKMTQRVILTLTKIPHQKLTKQNLPQKIRLTIKGYSERLMPDDKIRLRLRLIPIRPLSSPFGFDFKRQAYFQGIGATGIALSQPVILETGKHSAGWESWLEHIRGELTYILRAQLPRQEGAIASALITGDRSGISDQLQEQFNNSGLAHILAISGLHLSLVAGFIYLTLRKIFALIPPLNLRFPIQKWAAGVAIIVTFIYLAVAGFGVPARRAFIMVSLAMVAIIIDKQALSLRALALAATIILVFTPEALLGPSFQMSFAAVTVLIAGYEHWQNPISRWFGEVRLWKKGILYIGGLALSSLLANFATLPFTVYHFGRVSFFGLLANMVAIPLTAMIIIPTAFLECCLIPFHLEKELIQLLEWGIGLLIHISQYFSSWPHAVVLLPKPSALAFFLVILGGLWLCLWQKAWRVLGFIPLLMGVLFMCLSRPPDIWIDSEGKIVGLLKNNILYVTTFKAGRFTVRSWQATAGVASKEKLGCEDGYCLINMNKQKVAINIDNPDFNCPDTNVFISLISMRDGYRPSHQIVIGPLQLRKEGAHCLWLYAQGAEIVTARQTQGIRPWSIIREDLKQR